jgi:diadenosine tetraphosphatase ApaH/serine/threonine PP2A family protein phosphatase
MRIAIISDIHANLPALEGVLQRIGELKADATYCLGDIVGYGPFPNETVMLVQRHCSATVKGNHDSGVAGETALDQFNSYGQAGIRWTQECITIDNLEFLRSLPMTVQKDDLTIVHSSPVNPPEWTYVLTLQEAMEAFKAFSTRYCFIGHTHLPIMVGEDLLINHHTPGEGRYLINVGSVGQPRDRNPAAAFGLLDTEAGTYALHRVPYDIRRTMKAIRTAGLPGFLANRLLRGV